MKYRIITDTHLGHEKMVEYCGRPIDFGQRICRGLYSTIAPHDIVVHLGDVCIGDDEFHHSYLMGSFSVNCKKWLIRGNHDKKTNTWYLSHGWDFVASSITIDVFGERILFSHIPMPDGDYTINVHGHFHNSNHHRCEPEIKSVISEKHRLVMMEHHYLPQDLRKIVGK